MIKVLAIDMIFGEKSIIGNLVGTYTELQELMTLAARGKVRLSTRQYRLDQVNQAIGDLLNSRICRSGLGATCSSAGWALHTCGTSS